MICLRFCRTFFLDTKLIRVCTGLKKTVKSRLSECPLSETTGLFEDYGKSHIFCSIIYCNKTTYYSNFDYPKKSIFRSDSSVPIKEIAIKLPFKIRSPNVTHGDHDFIGQVRFTHLSNLANKVVQD